MIRIRLIMGNCLSQVADCLTEHLLSVNLALRPIRHEFEGCHAFSGLHEARRIARIEDALLKVGGEGEQRGGHWRDRHHLDHISSLVHEGCYL